MKNSSFILQKKNHADFLASTMILEYVECIIYPNKDALEYNSTKYDTAKRTGMTQNSVPHEHLIIPTSLFAFVGYLHGKSHVGNQSEDMHRRSRDGISR